MLLLLLLILGCALLHEILALEHNIVWDTNAISAASITIAPGDTVVWSWSAQTHNLLSTTSRGQCQYSGVWGSPAPANNGMYTRKFDEVGEFHYFCAIHCGALKMFATISVKSKHIIASALIA